MTKTIGDGDQRDFDETRRLLYMTLAAPHTKKYNLVGTLTNALLHHHGLNGDSDPSWKQIMDHLIAVVDDTNIIVDVNSDSRAWVLGQIERITDELGD